MMTADEAAASVQTIIEAVSTFPEAPPNFQFEAAFRMAYNLALHRYSEMLYGALEKFFCERAREMIPRKDFRMCAIMTRDVTMYMDRTYVASHKRTPVYDMADELLRRSGPARARALRRQATHTSSEDAPTCLGTSTRKSAIGRSTAARSGHGRISRRPRSNKTVG